MNIKFSSYNLLLILATLFNNSLAQDILYQNNFDNGMPAGWTTGAIRSDGGSDSHCSWAVGVPKGGRGYSDFPGQRGFVGNPDPLMDHTLYNSVNYVAGQGIRAESKNEGVSSHYNRSNEWIQTGKINCSNYINTHLTFWRWANFEDGYDKAIVEISTDGTTWINLDHTLYPQDTIWTMVSFNIAPYADHAGVVYIRWRSESDTYIHYSGWNIDDVIITGTYNINNSNSRISAGAMAEPLTISSLVDAEVEKLGVFDFTLQDMGSGDKLSTLIDTLTITPGNNNKIVNWKNAIAGAYLYGPDLGQVSGTELRGKIDDNKIVFGGSHLMEIADRSSETYTVRIYLKKNLSFINDNENIEFYLDYRNIVESDSGSFIGSGSTESGDNNLRIDIAASRLAFTTDPEALVTVNTILTPAVAIKAIDENGNTDKDFTSVITLSNSASLGMLNNALKAQAGISSYPKFQIIQSGGPLLLSASCNNKGIQAATSIIKVTVVASKQNVVFTENFDKTAITGWTSGAITGGNSWTFGQPKGGRGYSDSPGNKGFAGNPDPVQDHTPDNTINNVFGQGLGYTSKFEGVSSYYNNSNEWLKSPSINCERFTNIKLKFWRWANLESAYDKAYVEISTDGINWADLGQPLYPQDNAWTLVEIDISQYADKMPAVYIRWRSVSNQYTHYAGWNIDDVSLEGQYAPTGIWTGSVSSDWNNTGNWSNGSIPDMFTSVKIPGTAVQNPVVSGNAMCRDIFVGKGKALIVQSIGALTVYGDATVETDLISYGSILDIGNLTLNGKLIINRYIAGKGWYYIASPVAGFKSNRINNAVFLYNEPQASKDWTKAWQRVTSDNLENVKGYDVYFSQADTVVFSGQFNTGYQQIMLSNTDGNELPAHEGWNLVGNPYPSAIDWDATSGWNKTNVENAIYIWDETQSNYKTYVNGLSINGGSRYIPPMQGYFVRVSAHGATQLSMNNAVRVVTTESRFKRTSSGNEGIKLTIRGNGYYDETIIALRDNATTGYDTSYDAYKKFTDNTNVPQLFSRSENNDALAINSLPTGTEYLQIPLGLVTTAPGSFTFTTEGVIENSNGSTIYLEDKQTGNFVDLIETHEYEFTASLSDSSGRFMLHIGMPLTLRYTKSDVTCNSHNNGKIDLSVMGGRIPYQHILWSNGSDFEDLENIAAGEYEVVVVDAANTAISQTISITEPETIGFSTDVHDASAAEANDGFIDLMMKEESGSYTFEWSNKATTEDIFNLFPGDYTVTVTDEKGCVASSTIAVAAESSVTDVTTGEKDDMIMLYSDMQTIFIILSEENSDVARVEIYSIAGNRVYYQALNSVRNQIHANLPKGNYVVKVVQGNYQVTGKVILQ
jgi:hypothetical protein